MQSAIIEIFPEFGPLTLLEARELEVKKDVGNLSNKVRVYYISATSHKVTFIFPSLRSINSLFGTDITTVSYRLKHKTPFLFNNEKTISFREEELLKNDLISNHVSFHQFNKIISQVKEKNENAKIERLLFLTNELPADLPFTTDAKSVLCISLFGEIMYEFPSLHSCADRMGIVYQSVQYRVKEAAIFNFEDMQLRLAYKKKISKKSLETLMLTETEMKEISYQGRLYTEKRNRKIREKNGWTVSKQRVPKQDLINHFTNQHGETKEFKQRIKLQEIDIPSQ